MFGVPELMVVLVAGVPILAVMWGVVTLKRIRAGQEAVQTKLENIERLLQRS